MDDRTITIEISRESAVLLIWIAAGVVVIGSTFLVAFDPLDHWATVNATGLASALYLGAFVGHVLRPPLQIRTRVIGMVLLAAFVGTFAYGWRGMEETSRWQRWLLLDIRSTIGRGILRNDVPPYLEKVLQTRIGSSNGDGRFVGQAFREINPLAAVGSNLLVPRWAGDSVKIIVTELTDTSVVLTGIDVAAGWDPLFRNVNGRAGLIQEWYRLTERGIEYGTDN